MSHPAKRSEPRRPQAFDLDEPGLVATAPQAEPADAAAGGAEPVRTPAPRLGLNDIHRGFRWGTLLLSAMTALASLAAALWFVRFVSVALARDDWLGWTASGLLVVIGIAFAALLLRELVGFLRLGRLADLRARADALLTAPDGSRERALVGEVKALVERQDDMRWALARMAEHERDVHDAGALLALADRELVAPLDVKARAIVAGAAKRVSVVTALSPMAMLAVGYVAVENIRMLRQLATAYGGRPGFLGSLRLAHLVLGHIVATGGVAMTDDLLGQFLGQDLLRRLSRRLGEGIFNGALTARIGTAAIEVTRPLPFIEARPVRARDFIGELLRRQGGNGGKT